MQIPGKFIMKKSFSLLELIFGLILMLSLIFLSIKINENYIEVYKSKTKILLLKMNLESLALFINHKLKNCLKLNIKGKKLELIAADYKDLTLHKYYGFASLKGSKANVLLAPKSDFDSLKNIKEIKYINFLDSNFYQIKSLQNNKIFLNLNLKNINIKKYFLLARDETFYFKDNALYLNNEMIFYPLKSFSFSKNNKVLDYKLCLNNKICKSYTFRLGSLL